MLYVYTLTPSIFCSLGITRYYSIITIGDYTCLYHHIDFKLMSGTNIIVLLNILLYYKYLQYIASSAGVPGSIPSQWPRHTKDVIKWYQ